MSRAFGRRRGCTMQPSKERSLQSSTKKSPANHMPLKLIDQYIEIIRCLIEMNGELIGLLAQFQCVDAYEKELAGIAKETGEEE